MPDFRFDDRQLTDLVNAILAGTLQVERAVGETPRVVHFETVAKHRENVFEKQCGPCHRVLTETQGALGRGDIGPNLSGLFTEHYPASLKSGGRWTADILKKWLNNPRTIREYSQMRPVPLNKEESAQLLVILATKPRQ